MSYGMYVHYCDYLYLMISKNAYFMTVQFTNDAYINLTVNGMVNYAEH